MIHEKVFNFAQASLHRVPRTTEIAVSRIHRPSDNTIQQLISLSSTMVNSSTNSRRSCERKDRH